MIRFALLPLVLGCLLLAGCQSSREDASEALRYNEVQFLGSHNSYKLPIDPVVLSQLSSQNPAAAFSLDYSHAPLDEQLDIGLRKLELDVFYDPEGGRYATPMGAAMPGASEYDPDGRMQVPGFKTLHVQDIDFRSHCLLLVDCLATIRSWSDDNPGHFPLLVTINAKTGRIDQPGFVEPLPFDRQAWDALDREIRGALGDRLVEPDDIRGDAETLRAAVLASWPTVDQLRGKVLFLLDDSAEKKRAYAEGHPSLTGRAMFVDAPEDAPEAAFRIVNDPVSQEPYIRELVRQGFIVRTRSDADTREARSGDNRRLEAALRSGAQIISTDYYLPETRFGTGFVVALPGGAPVRCNPVLVTDACTVPE